MIRCHKQFLAKLLNWLKLVMGLEISNVRASVVMLKIIVTLASGFKRDNKMFLMLALQSSYIPMRLIPIVNVTLEENSCFDHQINLGANQLFIFLVFHFHQFWDSNHQLYTLGKTNNNYTKSYHTITAVQRYKKTSLTNHLLFGESCNRQ